MVAVVGQALHHALVVTGQGAAGTVETHPADAVGLGDIQPVPEEIHARRALQPVYQGFHRIRVAVAVGIPAQQDDVTGVGTAYQQVAIRGKAQKARPRQVGRVQLHGEAIGQLQAPLHGAGTGGRAAQSCHHIEDHAQAAAVDGARGHEYQGHGGHQHCDSQ